MEPRLRRAVTDADRLLARVLVFDGFIENLDRSSSTNPNLLVSNGKLFVIDHGQALPSVQGSTTKLPFPFDSHLGWNLIQDQPYLLEEPLKDLRSLSDSAIDRAVDAVPDAWWTEAGRPDQVRLALRERRDELPGTLERLMERLR